MSNLTIEKLNVEVRVGVVGEDQPQWVAALREELDSALREAIDKLRPTLARGDTATADDHQFNRRVRAALREAYL
ncbi:hypothetical protein SFA35_18645 [Pseudomonas sp. HR96]|uniref:hypothetical protein n=1 Tax=Pseudomonas sp. HR96 TaxID=1027966 RepID=UPI002A7482FC|nr:hypothetical protein [Pseudomonas sp. HR96]WPO98639.1 hypothetical protein SFA35_18645 [Pseudomonas sp. HR96]